MRAIFVSALSTTPSARPHPFHLYFVPNPKRLTCVIEIPKIRSPLDTKLKICMAPANDFFAHGKSLFAHLIKRI